jgi:hypothetical protein
MRTSVIDIVRLAWHLYRHPYRKYASIGQMLDSAMNPLPVGTAGNHELLARLARRLPE